MANGEQTAGSLVKGISPVLGAVPYVGPILSMAGTMVGGALEASGAKKQAEQAARMRQDALNTQKQALRPEYLQALRMKKMLALQGLPGYDLMKGQVSAATAAGLRGIKEASQSGASTLNAISAAKGLENQNIAALAIQDAQARLRAQENLGNTVWAVGDKQRQLEDIRDQQKREGLAAAAGMENAATFNKLNAIKGAIGGITQGANTISNTALQTGEADKNRKLLVADNSDNALGVESNPLSDNELNDVMKQYNQLLLKSANGELTKEEMDTFAMLRDLMKKYSLGQTPTTTTETETSPLAEPISAMVTPKD